MIRIVAQLNLKEGCKKEFIQLSKELIVKSQGEDGCIEYDLYQSQSEENTVTFIEVWKDMDAIDSHNKSTHFTTIVPTFSQFVASQEVTLYDQIK